MSTNSIPRIQLALKLSKCARRPPRLVGAGALIHRGPLAANFTLRDLEFSRTTLCLLADSGSSKSTLANRRPL